MSIDAHHLEVARHLAAVKAAIDTGRSEVVSAALDYFLQRVRHHFEAEESTFHREDSLSARSHKAAHRDFLEHCLQLSSDWRTCQIPPSLSMGQLMSEWLQHHLHAHHGHRI